MVDLSVATEHSRANDPGVLDLREFPALADLRMVGSGGEVRQQVVDVAIGDQVGSVGVTLEVDDRGNSNAANKMVNWNALFSGHTLDFYPPVKKDGRTYVQPPQEIIDLGAKQWENALLGNFLGKSLPLGVFQRTADKLWGREGSVTIRFLASSVYLLNFPSKRVRDWVLESAMFDLPSAITVDLGNDNCVEVGVELDWAPPKCSHCAIFGHTLDNCKKMVLSNECYQGDSSCSLKGVESDAIVPKVGTAGAVGDVMSDSVEGLANGNVADGMVAGVVNESVNAEVVGGVVVGSDGGVAVVIRAGVYDASIEVVVAVDSVVSASLGDVGSVAFLKEMELGGTTNKFEVLCSIVEYKIV
ncbi:hypothetical protein V6N11_063049 [Hibiscus sabdariffa]|uniref:DUF4283 domain-containing protein n=1 Tax=Hibiscus sabdariffa TaxID=183260 RepID=A0ABR2NQ18_9ROSI